MAKIIELTLFGEPHIEPPRKGWVLSFTGADEMFYADFFSASRRTLRRFLSRRLLRGGGGGSGFIEPTDGPLPAAQSSEPPSSGVDDDLFDEKCYDCGRLYHSWNTHRCPWEDDPDDDPLLLDHLGLRGAYRISSEQAACYSAGTEPPSNPAPVTN